MKQIHVFTQLGTAISFFDGQFKFLADQGYDIIIASTNHNLSVEFSKKNNIRFCPIEIPRSISPIVILKAIISIVKLIKQENPDAVFGHTPVAALCAMVASRLCNIKNRVYYRHGLIYTTMKGVKYYLFLWEERFVSFLSTAIVNVSLSLSELALSDCLNPGYKNNIIGRGTCGGIDANYTFNPSLIKSQEVNSICRKLGIDNKQDIIFGFCGRLCKDKGIPELVEGFIKFKSLHKDLASKLILIGGLDERDILPPALLDTIKHHKDIIITGYINKTIIPYYYSVLDVFVFPSHREGFGMSVLEASAMQKPILVSRSHGCVDSIIEHITGEYIDLSADSICSGMERMLDKELQASLGNNGRNMVLEYYDHRIMWPLINDLYKSILL